MPQTNQWTRDQTIVALNLYCKIPFNKVSSRHPDILRISRIIGRTPNSVKMKIGNFGSFDPELKRRGIVGLSNASELDKEVWAEYSSDWERLGYESEALIAQMMGEPLEKVANISVNDLPEGRERLTMVRQRINQGFFRATILSSYNNSCCITGLSIPSLLVASHIRRWADDPANRMNPHNGLCLNALHDKAFDQGLITFDSSYRVKVSALLIEKIHDEAAGDLILRYDGLAIRLPDRFLPSQEFLEHHRQFVFEKY